MRWVHCNGEMERSTAPFHVDRHGDHLVLDTVPAGVSGQCGEARFEDQEAETIQGR